MDFDETRKKTLEKLRGKEEVLRTAADINLLESFAKAYLGMLLEIDSHVEPHQRVHMLTDPALAECILQGFESVLHHREFPAPREIGSSKAMSERIPVGFVVLAGMDRLSKKSPDAIIQLPRDTIAAAVCFHYANKTELEEHWFKELAREMPELVSDTLCEFWLGMIAKGTLYLPGLKPFLQNREMLPYMNRILLPILEQWQDCRKAFLYELLQASLCYADQESLYELGQKILSERPPQQVALRVYWMATCFLIHPERHEVELFEYMGRTREKAIPLINFLFPLLVDGIPCKRSLPVSSIGWLLHMLAPKIAPHIDQFGRMEENAKKVIQLFDLLKQYPAEEAQAEIRRLRKIRVMKIYSYHLDEIERSL